MTTITLDDRMITIERTDSGAWWVWAVLFYDRRLTVRGKADTYRGAKIAAWEAR